MTNVSKKPIIAVDIDDVLAAQAEAFVAYSNDKWGTHLTVDDYDEHWGMLWQVDLQETGKRAKQLHNDRLTRFFRHRSDALPVLRQLARRFELVIVTSRPSMTKTDTVEWLNLHFTDIFTSIYFAGMWDEVTEESILSTKGDLCKQIGASYLIDDQLKHCLAVAAEGIEAILFGNYTWNQAPHLPDNVTRCQDWAAIQSYFQN